MKSFFLPHPKTHKKAELLSWHFLVIYILLFILLKAGINLVEVYKPGVLGVNSNITVDQIIEETNKERQKVGLPPVTKNLQLTAAASGKATNMFTENYWAHNSPSGQSPWDFIKGAGYKFTYAGENLARNFYTSDEVVKAWMNSPSHRENLLNPKYKEIGIAVVDGVLLGEKTTLVVQEFGTSYQPVALSPRVKGEEEAVSNLATVRSTQPIVLGSENIKPAVFDPTQISKLAGISLILFIGSLIMVDLVALKRRGVLRLSSHHLAHLSFLALAGTTLLTSHAGEIL